MLLQLLQQQTRHTVLEGSTIVVRPTAWPRPHALYSAAGTPRRTPRRASTQLTTWKWKCARFVYQTFFPKCVHYICHNTIPSGMYANYISSVNKWKIGLHRLSRARMQNCWDSLSVIQNNRYKNKFSDSKMKSSLLNLAAEALYINGDIQ